MATKQFGFQDSQNNEIVLRMPTENDAASIWRLVETSDTLDHNSFYCYFLLCRHFASTCAVAESGGEVLGFVTGYRQPLFRDTLFVWQIRVLARMRGRGLGTALITDVLKRPEVKGVSFIEATIAPTNTASQSLFRAVARKLETVIDEDSNFLAKNMFPREIDTHEPEHLFRIGPFTLNNV